MQQRSLDLALELERNNRARVDVGQSPPLDLVAARAEVAQRQENLIIARTAALQTEDNLRTLIIDPKRAGLLERPARAGRSRRRSSAAPPDVDAAVRRALGERTDLEQARADDSDQRDDRRAVEEPDAARPAACRPTTIRRRRRSTSDSRRRLPGHGRRIG